MNSIKNFSVKGFSGKLAILQISLYALFFSMFLSGCPNLQAPGKSVVAVNLPTGGGRTQNSRQALPNPENRKTDDISLWTVNLVHAEEHSLYQTQNGKSGKTVEFEIYDEIPLTIEVFALSENGEIYVSGKSEEFTTKLGQTTEVTVNAKWNYLSVKPDSEDLISISEVADRNFYFSVRAECAEDETAQISFEWFSSKTESSGTNELPSDAESEGNGESEYIKSAQNSYDYYRNVFRGNFDSSSDTQVYYCIATRKYPYFNSPESKKILGPFVVTSASLQSINVEYKTKSGSNYDILCGGEIHLSDFRITEKFSDGKERYAQNPSEDYFSLDFSTFDNDSEKGNTIYKIGNVPAKIQSNSNPQISAETKVRVAYDFSGKFDSFGGTKAETKLAAKIYAFDGVNTKIGEEIKTDNEKFIFYDSDYRTSSEPYSEISLNYAYTWTSIEEYVIRESKVNQISLDMADLNLTKNTNLTQTAKISLASNENAQTSPQELSPEKQVDAKKYLLNLPESIETHYPISIYNWNVSIKDGSGIKADEKNLSARTTYTVSAENAAYTSETFEEIKKHISLSKSSSSSSPESEFTENGMTFTTPSAKTSTQGTEIRVKFTNDATGTGGIDLTRLNVQVPADIGRTLTKIEATYKGTGYVLGSGQSGNRLTELPETLPPSDFTVTEYYKDVEENETSAQVNDLSDYTFRWQANVNRSLSIGQVPVSVSKNGANISIADIPVTVKYNGYVYNIDTEMKQISTSSSRTNYIIDATVTPKEWTLYYYDSTNADFPFSESSETKPDKITYQWATQSSTSFNYDDIRGETNPTYSADVSNADESFYQCTITINCDTSASSYFDTSKTIYQPTYRLVVTSQTAGTSVTNYSDLKTEIEKIALGQTGTILLESGTYEATSSSITANGNVTVKTNSTVTISRGDSFTGEFFNVGSGASLKLEADFINTLVLDGGWESGNSPKTLALISSKGSLEITGDVTLQNNYNGKSITKSDQSRYGSSYGNYGGAIHVSPGNGNASDNLSLTFYGNIKNCRANNGGAIAVIKSTGSSPIPVNMTNATIEGNTANSGSSGNGGGLNLINVNATLSDTTFSGNQCQTTGGGGAIYIGGANSVITLTNCNFDGNLSSKSPDSIYLVEGVGTNNGTALQSGQTICLDSDEYNYGG